MLTLLTITAALAQSTPQTTHLQFPTERIKPDFSLAETDHGTQNIVNGWTTSDYAAVGSLVAVYEEGVHSFCSGTLVTSNSVLTAAHCVEGMEELMEYDGFEGFVFVFGTDLSDEGVDDWAIITEGMIHPEYSRYSLEWDLGMVVLDQDITTTTPMCVNTAPIDDEWLGNEVDYVGWGMADDELWESSGIKRTVSIPIEGYNETHLITYDEDANVCNGDSGGAAIVEREDGTRMVAGVNSYVFSIYGEAASCGREGAAGAAARTDTAMDWIRSYTGDISCDSSSAPDCEEGYTREDGECVPADDGPSTDGQTELGSSSLSDATEFKASCSCSSGGNAGTGIVVSLLAMLGLIRRRQG